MIDKQLIGILLLLLLGVTIALGVIGMFQKGLRKWDAHEILWMVPWATWGFASIVGLFILSGPIIFTLIPHKASDRPGFVMLDSIIVCGGLFVMRLSVGTRLHFDLDHRTYSYSECLLVPFRNVTGTFDDIRGVYMHSSSRSNWMVWIAWKKASPMRNAGIIQPALVAAPSRIDAEASAEELARALGVRVLPNPFGSWG